MASPPRFGNGPQVGDSPWRPGDAASEVPPSPLLRAAAPPAPRTPVDKRRTAQTGPLSLVPPLDPPSAQAPASEARASEPSPSEAWASEPFPSEARDSEAPAAETTVSAAASVEALAAEAPRSEAPRSEVPHGKAPAGQSVVPAPPGSGKRRLAWLDALRGIAALCVVFDHLSYHVLTHVHVIIYKVFDPGLYGVAVFFLVSGFIVPASLERGGSVRKFWVGRAFRLYPLFLVTIAIVLVMHQFNIGTLRGADATPRTAVFSHLLMLSDLLGVPSVINVFWTLSFEMVFYLLLTALFVLGVHRRSGDYALGFGVAAVALGGILPAVGLSSSALGGTKVAALADLLIIVGLVLAISGRALPRVFGASLAASTALVLLVFNDRRIPTEGFVILALMFTGTMIYRWQEGQIGRNRAIWTAVAVFALITAAGAWHIGQVVAPAGAQAGTPRRWVISLTAAGLTFALGLALRNRSFPRFLAWLGLVSYSVYVMHYPVIYLYEKIKWTHEPHPIAIQLLAAAAFLAVLLAVSALSYRVVERPMQLLGRRVGKALDARMGSDRIAVGRHAVAAEPTP